MVNLYVYITYTDFVYMEGWISEIIGVHIIV